MLLRFTPPISPFLLMDPGIGVYVRHLVDLTSSWLLKELTAGTVEPYYVPLREIEAAESLLECVRAYVRGRQGCSCVHAIDFLV